MKNSIKTVDISSLLNTDLCNLNESSLILYDDRLSTYNTIYIFLKFTSPIGKKTEAFLDKNNKSIFSKPKILLAELKRRVSGLIIKNILKLVIPDTSPWL